MNNSLHLISGVVLGLLLAGVGGCRHAPSAKPALEGRWVGFDEAHPDVQLTLQLTNGQFSYGIASEETELGQGTYQVKDAIQPAEMDLRFERGVRSDYIGKVALAIYELNGDQLRIAGREPGTPDRPIDFVGGDGVRVFSWIRQ